MRPLWHIQAFKVSFRCLSASMLCTKAQALHDLASSRWLWLTTKHPWSLNKFRLKYKVVMFWERSAVFWFYPFNFLFFFPVSGLPVPTGRGALNFQAARTGGWPQAVLSQLAFLPPSASFLYNPKKKHWKLMIKFLPWVLSPQFSWTKHLPRHFSQEINRCHNWPIVSQNFKLKAVDSKVGLSK